MDKITSSSVVRAALVFNLLHMLAWELPVALRQGWTINIIGDYIVLSIAVLSILLITLERKAGLILAAVPALWAVLLQWLLVYVLAGHGEPNGVWWYPLFPVFQGVMIGYFIIRALRGDEGQPELMHGAGLRSPSIYLHATAGFLLVQTGQKFVREIVVGYLDNGGLRGAMPSTLLALVAIVAAVMLIKRVKWGLVLAVFSGALLLMQPVIYHLIMGKPCLGGIWWYPFYTAVQGSFILYFSAAVILKERSCMNEEVFA